jgi:hypothetical protein
MNDAGYTLSETLAAMAVLGLAIGGLTLGAEVIGSQQLSTGNTVKQLQSIRATQGALEQMLARGAPFGAQQPDQLAGDSQALHFACGAPQPCAAQIVTAGTGSRLTLVSGEAPATSVTLSLPRPARFSYRGARTAGDIWPPADPAGQILRSIAVLQTAKQGDISVIEAKVWPEQRARCGFDAVAQECL